MYLDFEKHKAYLIKPCKGFGLVKHQYGCLYCSQFEIAGIEIAIPEEQARKAQEVLGCNSEFLNGRNLGLASKIVGLPIEEILGEGLARLKNGDYLAVENCD